MKPGDGRIVNVSSASGELGQFGKRLQMRFRDPVITLEDVEALAKEYEVCFHDHSLSSVPAMLQDRPANPKICLHGITSIHLGYLGTNLVSNHYS